jgi:hypothetical protein
MFNTYIKNIFASSFFTEKWVWVLIRALSKDYNGWHTLNYLHFIHRIL